MLDNWYQVSHMGFYDAYIGTLSCENDVERGVRLRAGDEADGGGSSMGGLMEG